MLSLLLLWACFHVSWAKTVYYDFNIGWVSRAPDGFSRPVIGINGQWPIPTIEADVNDTIVVTAHNSLGNETTSLHFHGMYQRETSISDGPVGVTQCPISPGQSFTYTFTAWPAGTHWYHSHNKGQYPDGLRGKMIIHNPEWEKSLNIDEQIPLSISDWYHTEMPYLIHDFLNVKNAGGHLPVPNSFLVNDTSNPPCINFEPKKRYLLRIVSHSAIACGLFYITDHNLTVVAVDGQEVHPRDTDKIIICAGQSYDVVVTGHSNPKSGIQYIAKMTPDMLTLPPPPEDKITLRGSIKYTKGGQQLEASQQPSTSNFLDDVSLQPLDNEPLLQNPSKWIYFRTNQRFYENIGTRIGLGQEPWVEPKVPTLYTALSTNDNAFTASTYGPGVAPEIVKYNEVVQIHMQNLQPFAHPMHLHGHVFQVAARGKGSWDGKESSLHPIPMKRDTVVIPPEGYLVLRFHAWNAGVWLFHCHIDFHLVGGMAASIIEAPDVLQRQQTIPESGSLLCTANRQGAFGNCAGQSGQISAADAAKQCNTVLNSNGESYGALVT